MFREFPGGGEDSMLSLPWAWVQSLFRELRSRKPCSMAKKESSFFISGNSKSMSTIIDILNFFHCACSLSSDPRAPFPVRSLVYVGWVGLTCSLPPERVEQGARRTSLPIDPYRELERQRVSFSSGFVGKVRIT